jgi:ABC-type oligopeptide transport system substrate-binding subunit
LIRRKIELEPNPNYYDTTMVKATEIKFAFSDDATAMLNSYKAGSYLDSSMISRRQIATIPPIIRASTSTSASLAPIMSAGTSISVAFNKVANTEAETRTFRNGLSLLINRQLHRQRRPKAANSRLTASSPKA